MTCAVKYAIATWPPTAYWPEFI